MKDTIAAAVLYVASLIVWAIMRHPVLSGILTATAIWLLFF